MKKIIIALMGAAMLFTSGLASSIEANGWRLNVTSSVDEETHVVVSEVEFLDFVDVNTPPVDVTQLDLGNADCGFNCDSVSTNQIGDANADFLANPRRNRKVGVAFDNNQSSAYTTDYKIGPDPGNFYVQYTIYKGSVTPARPKLDIRSYSVSAPSGDIGTGAPGGWTVEYLSLSTNQWVVADTREAGSSDVNWNNAGRVYEVSSGGLTYYLVDSSGTRKMVAATDDDWSAPLTGSALTDATTAISDNSTLVGRRLEFDL